MIWFGLVWFYGISAILVYSLPNVLYAYILNICFANCSVSSNSIYQKTSVCSKFKCQTVLSDSLIGLYQVLPLRVRVDLRAMVMKVYSAFP